MANLNNTFDNSYQFWVGLKFEVNKILIIHDINLYIFASQKQRNNQILFILAIYGKWPSYTDDKKQHLDSIKQLRE